MSVAKPGDRMPVRGPDGAVIGEAIVWSIDQDGSVNCEIRIDPPVPDWLKEDTSNFSIDTTTPPLQLFPVVITQTRERVTWVRAYAEDHATDIVAEDPAEYFAGDRSFPQNGPIYDVRSIPPEQVLPSLPEK